MHIKNPVEVWTRLVSDPHEPDALRPDLPKHVGFAARGGIVRDLMADGAPVATEHVSVFVEAEHAGANVCPQLADPSDVADRDKLLVAMARTPRGARKAFFDALDMTGASDARKREVKDVLLQAVARGLSPAKAEGICARLGLAEGVAQPFDELRAVSNVERPPPAVNRSLERSGTHGR